MTTTIKAYKEVCKVLGINPANITKVIPDMPGATTVIVPNDIFEWAQIKKLAVAFGEDQPYPTYTYDDLYSQYTPQQLSGKTTDAPTEYRVVYIPKEWNVKADTAENQAKAHKVEHVPSVLEAICFWYALRASKQSLDFDSTYIRHFDLPAKRLGGWLRVPSSFVSAGGGPDLNVSYAESDNGARLAVGENLKFDAPAEPLDLETRVSMLEEQMAKLREALQ